MFFQPLLFLCIVFLVEAGKQDYVFYANEEWDKSDYKGIRITAVDFVTPNNPVKFSSVLCQRNTTKASFVGYKPSGLVIDDTGSFAYLFGWGDPDKGGDKNGTLWVIQIKETSLEVKSVTYNISCANAAYIPMIYDQGYLYIVTGIPSANMYIFDVRDSTLETLPPPTIWNFSYWYTFATPRCKKHGKYLYSMVGASRFEIVDISKPGSPSTVRLLDDEEYNAATGFTVTDRLLVVNYQASLGLFDLSDATNPKWIEPDDDDGEVAWEGLGVQEIWSSGKFVFVLLAECPYYDSCYYTLEIYDMDDPQKPKLAGFSEPEFNVNKGGNLVQNLMRGNFIYMTPNVLAMNVEGLVPTIAYKGNNDPQFRDLSRSLIAVTPCPTCPFNGGVTLGASSFLFVLMCALLLLL